MRAYLRLDPNIVERKNSYPDGAFRAYIECLANAEQQPKRGRFRSRRLLSVLLERRSRWINYLLEHGDLVELPSGALYVEGWDEWQEGDVTVSERMKRLRSRRRDVTPPDTPLYTPPVTVETVTGPYSGGGGTNGGASGGGAPSRAPNGSEATKSFMGFRPRPTDAEMAADVARQEAEAWEKCGRCGKLRRSHVPADHVFVNARAATR